MPIKLESKEQYKYDDKYATFLGYVLGDGKLGEDYAQSFAREVDLLQESAFELRNNFSEIAVTEKTHENHKAAFVHLTHAYQYQLDRVEELIHHIVTKVPLVDATKKAQLQQQIERAEIFSALQKAHFVLETEYAALKDNKKDKDKQKQKAYETEFTKKEPVVKQLRETMSKLNKKFEKLASADAKQVEIISKELDLLINQYNQQKSEFDKLAQQPVVETPDSSKPVEKEKKDKKDKKDKKQKDTSESDSSKKSKKDNKIIGALNFVGNGVKKAGSTVLAAPETIVGAAKKAGSAVIVKPGQQLVRSFSAILVQKDQPLDRNLSVSEPNRTKEHDQVLLNDKSSLDVKYKKALENKISELEKPNDLFSKEEKVLAAQLLISARNFLAKMNLHKEPSNIEMTVKAEKELFLKDLRALLFPQLKANNRQLLKLQIEDLNTQKRLINKMTSKNDEIPKNKYFHVIDECISAIKKARKKIKVTKSYDEMMVFMLPLAADNEKCKAAKGVFNKYLTESTASPNPVDGRVSPDSTSGSGSPNSGSALSARSSMGDFSDERTGDIETLTGSAISSISTRSPSPASSHSDFLTPRSSIDPANKDENEVIDDKNEEAKLAELEAQVLELKKQEDECKREQQNIVEQIELTKIRIDQAEIEYQITLLQEQRKQEELRYAVLIKTSEERTAQLEKNFEEERKREMSEIASRKTQIEMEMKANAKAQEELQKEFTKIAREKSQIEKELSEVAAERLEAKRLLALFTAEAKQFTDEAEKYAAERVAAELEVKRSAEALEKLARETKQAEERIAAEEKQKAEEARLAKESEEKRVHEEKAQREAEEKAKRDLEEQERLAAEKKLADERVASEEKRKAEEARLAKESEEKRVCEEQAQHDAEKKVKRDLEEQERLAAEKKLAEERAAAEEKTRKERLERWGVSQGAGPNNSSSTADHAPQNMSVNDQAPIVEPVRPADNQNHVKPSSKQPFLVGKEQLEFTVEKMKTAQQKIQAFMAKLLIEDEAQKKSWWPFYFKDTKLTKHAELQKLCDVIKEENNDNAGDFYEAVKKARKDGGTLTQSIKSDRARTLLDNILDGHPEYGTDHLTKEQRAERKARISSIRKSSPGNRR